MKFTKPFRGVPDGEIYPVEYQSGDECPSEFEASAVEIGAVDAAPTENKARTKRETK